jgi:hypothetical protein
MKNFISVYFFLFFFFGGRKKFVNVKRMIFMPFFHIFFHVRVKVVPYPENISQHVRDFVTQFFHFPVEIFSTITFNFIINCSIFPSLKGKAVFVDLQNSLKYSAMSLSLDSDFKER